MDSIIVIIGNEVLSGETLDTNSQFFGKVLNDIGIQVIKKISIPDSKEAISAAITEAMQMVPIVIMSGGLGPTNDDITRDVIADYFGSDLVFNAEVFENIKVLLKHRMPNLTHLNENQAMIPACSVPLYNRLGSAPGLLIEQNDKMLFALPGVPYEAQNLMSEQVAPELKKRVFESIVINRNIRTAGLPESYIANQVKDIETALPENIKLAYLPHLGQVKLRLTVKGKNRDDLETEIDSWIYKFSDRLGQAVFGFDEEELQDCIGHILKNKNSTLSVAESCTGGFISHLITSVAGSSDYFKGGIVAYSNEIKINDLNVDKKILEEFGAVSRENAEAMARGVLAKFKTDFALATTGIAGPGGGSDEKPTGTLWMAVADNYKVISKKIVFDRGRKQNIEFFSVSALNLLRKFILEFPVD